MKGIRDNWPVDIWPVTFLRGRTIGLSSLILIGQSVFELESGNGNVDRQTNKLTELLQIRKQVSHDGNLLPVNFEVD